MSAKRKTFPKSDLTTPGINHIFLDDQVHILPEVIPPVVTAIVFPAEHTVYRTFDFAPWYGVGIDEITYACQRQIERFLAKQDLELTVLSIATSCRHGLKYFFDYLAVLTIAIQRPLKLADINRSTIDEFILSLDDGKCAVITRRTRYHAVKTVIKALCARGLVKEVLAGDNATFPRVPFPGADKSGKGEKALSKSERSHDQ